MHLHSAKSQQRVARRMKISRMLTALAMGFISILPQLQPAAAATLSATACSMNGRVQSNREFWDRLKRKQAEAARQKLPKDGYGTDAIRVPVKEQERKNSNPVRQD